MLALWRKHLQLIAVLALPIIWTVWLFGGWTTTPKAVVASISHNFHKLGNYYSHDPQDLDDIEDSDDSQDVNYSHNSEERFIDSILKRPVLHDFDPKEIQEYCSQQTWPDDLVYDCHGIIGGIGSVRQQIFTCIRWAMAAGAALVIPHPRSRRATNSTLGEGVYHKYPAVVELGHFFDAEAFKETMHTLCPQMRLYDNSTLDGTKYIDDIGQFKTPNSISLTEELYHNATQTFLNDHKSGSKGSIRFGWIGRLMKSSLVCSDGEGFANSMGHLLQTRPDIVRIAALVLYQMSTRFNIKIDPRDMLAPGSFAGVHLRTSSDAVTQGWMSYEKQAELYQKYLSKQPVPAIYVASGNLTSIKMFAERVEPTPVVDKFSLLSSEDAAALKSMTWDQQGQVDYLVLTRGSLFLGMADSLFSMSIASSRKAASKGGTCGEVPQPEEDITYDDGLSIVVGKSHGDNQEPMYFWP